MSKTLRKAIMKRSKLQNTFNKKRSSGNRQNYKRQRNICSNILNSTKKAFFETLNINETTANRKFWKTVKPFFTDKCKTSNNIILTEKKENLNDNKKITNTFNYYFTNITKDLNLRESTGNINFENEESCKKIKGNFGNENFSFETVSKKNVLDLIKELPGTKLLFQMTFQFQYSRNLVLPIMKNQLIFLITVKEVALFQKFLKKLK